jgi:lipopolysaccharide export system permease protein
MDLIGRYMFRQTAGALVMILTALSLIVWMAMALRQISVMTDEGQGLGLFMLITTLMIPGLIAIIAPFGLLLSSLHTLNRLNADSEIIVLTAAGGTIWRVLRPYFLLGIIVTIATFFVNAYVAPKCAQISAELIAQIRADLISQVLQPGQYTSVDRGMTIFVRDRDENGELHGLMLNDESKKDVTMTLLAGHGHIIQQDGHPYIMMYDGYIQHHKAGNPQVNIVSFDSYLYDLNELTGERQAKFKTGGPMKPQMYYLSELMFPTPEQAAHFNSSRRFASELHNRIAGPLYAIVFVLIAVLHLGYARTTREGRMETLVIAYTAAIFLFFCGLAAKNMADKSTWAISLIYAVPLVAIAGLTLMLVFNIKPLKLPSISFKMPRASSVPQK